MGIRFEYASAKARCFAESAVPVVSNACVNLRSARHAVVIGKPFFGGLG